MKTITIKTLAVDGEHFLLPDDELAKYDPSLVHAWTFEVEKLTAGTLVEVGNAVNAAPGLYGRDGQANAESLNLTYAAHIAEKTVKAWNFSIRETDGPLPITSATALSLPADVLLKLAAQIRRYAPPTPQEMLDRKNGSAAGTKSTDKAA